MSMLRGYIVMDSDDSSHDLYSDTSSVIDIDDEDFDFVGEDDADEESDPDYHPPGYMEEDANADTQSLSDTVSSSAASVNDVNQETTEPSRPVEGAERSEIGEKPEAKEEKLILPSQSSSGDEVCSICFEPWTNSGEHRLVCLKCGHLFGRSCICQWLKGQNSRCPQCNAKARKTDIRNIYSRAVRVIDSSERDKALEDLLKENQLRRTAEMEAAQERMKHCLAVQECERLKKELMDAQKQLQEYRAGLKKNITSETPCAESALCLLEKIHIVKEGGCRIVNSGDLLGMILVSQPSSNPLFPGFGFRKISTLSMKPCDFVLVHKKLIRDMAFHTHDGLVLTASVDKSMKITNVLSNTVVQTYELESDVWSCAWDADNAMYFYGGLKTGEVYVFDIRVTNRYVCELPRFGTKTPVVSLQYLPKPPFSSGGPVVGKLSDCALYQKLSHEGNYKLVPLPVLGPFTSLSSGPSGNILVSSRPSPKQPRICHTFCDFVTQPANELTCIPVKTVFGGRTQVHLTRSRLFNHPDNASSVLICAGDEDANGAVVWDGCTGDVVQKLNSDFPVLDLASLNFNQKFYLTTLTSTTLQVYGWNQR